MEDKMVTKTVVLPTKYDLLGREKSALTDGEITKIISLVATAIDYSRGVSVNQNWNEWAEKWLCGDESAHEYHVVKGSVHRVREIKHAGNAAVAALMLCAASNVLSTAAHDFYLDYARGSAEIAIKHALAAVSLLRDAQYA
jgi:hypothetical protein